MNFIALPNVFPNAYFLPFFSQDFLVQLINAERAKAEALLKVTPGGARQHEMSVELLADPLVFIRRWIGEVNIYVLL